LEKGLTIPDSMRLGIIIAYAIVIALSIDSSKTILIPFYSIPEQLLFATVLFTDILQLSQAGLNFIRYYNDLKIKKSFC